MKLDADLQSIQEARNMVQEAREAQRLVEGMDQSRIDAIVKNMAQAAESEAGRLAVLAVEETGFGKADDKRIKNVFAARDVYDAIKDMKTVGIVSRDDIRKVWEIAQPFGVIAGIVPSTNPTSTVIYKSLIAVKARNAIVFSPHPAARRCSAEAAEVMQRAAEQAGAPSGLVQCLTLPSMTATNELMKHPSTDLILATGGSAMVEAAYSSGKPAYGVGPGNVPVYVHASANIQEAVRRILESKTFDFGTICASEQALVVDAEVKSEFVATCLRQGAYLLDEQEKQKVSAVIMNGKGLNPSIVGRSPQVIGELSGISVPEDARVLIAEETNIGSGYPFSAEKLSPLLALYTVNDWQEGCRICMQLLAFGGMGHTLGIHCENEAVIESFGLEKPASRIVVNAGTTFGAIGATTGIMPSLTLGCGSYGHNITSDNIGPRHLMNLKRVAFGLKEMRLERAAVGYETRRADEGNRQEAQPADNGASLGISREEVLDIIKSVLAEMKTS
ncbi:acetaldehyde dehydrogenase (acetylating) [Paenibacillus sp. MBLB4367]|uniref:acetaldehyde dehydrogenase (acetylating) n=1 Tax=Paenibacillus sp. MBLB4367 TaxID=3384767 RepID=UPI0039083023